MARLVNVYRINEEATLTDQEIAELMQAIQENPPPAPPDPQAGLRDLVSRVHEWAKYVSTLQVQDDQLRGSGAFRTMFSTSSRLAKMLSNPQKISRSAVSGIYMELFGAAQRLKGNVYDQGLADFLNDYLQAVYDLVRELSAH